MSALAATTNTVANKDGAYVRHAAKHRTDAVEAEAGRYHLHVALACPWAAGALSMLYLKGLEDAISLSIVHPTWQRTRPGRPGGPALRLGLPRAGRRAALEPARPRLL